MSPNGGVVLMPFKSMLSVCLAILLFSSVVMILVPAVKAPDTDPPWVVSYSPPDGATHVPVTAQIYVNFSEPMNLLTVVIDIQPSIALTPVWGMETNLVLTHAAPFMTCVQYAVNVSGDDLAGNSLDGNHDGVGGDPLVWRFVTDCGGPYIIRTVPADGDIDVPLNQAIIITFSERINPVTYTVSIIPAVTYTPIWMNGDTVLTLTHALPFQTCTIYTVSFISPDLVPGPSPPGLVPNPWHFTTTGCQPVITAIYPPQTDAPIDAAIRVDFSTSLNNATVTWNLNRTLNLAPAWSPGNKTLSLSHTVKFLPCTSYGFSITGKDMFGQTLGNGAFPMPYNFTTVCTYPKVLLISPSRAQNNVPFDAPIIVTFSESMEAKSVEDSFSYNDDRPTFFNASDGTSAWNQDSTTFTFTPYMPYRGLITYSVRVNATAHGLGDNPLDGNSNGAFDGRPADDYVWQFTTAQVTDVTPPEIQSVSPLDGAVDVPRATDVVIIFSEAMNNHSVQEAIQVSSGEFAYNFDWTSNRTVTFDLAPPLLYGNVYTITVKKTATDLVGNEMLSDYAWTFTTELWRGDVHGRVVDDSNGEPIANATVTLNGIQTLTDGAGNFTFRNVRQGIYRLNASKVGYDISSESVGVGPGSRDLGTIRLKPAKSSPPSETPWLAIGVALVMIVLVVLLILILMMRKRRKVQPADFEQWKGEVAEAERPGPEQ